MNPRIVTVWTVALGASATLGWVALQHPSSHRPPALSSGPLFAVPSHAAVEPVRASAVTQVTITLTDGGCVASPSTMPAGPATFTVVNPGDTVVNEAELTLTDGSRILAEAEDVDPGQKGQFSYRLAAGAYALNCPGTHAPPAVFTALAHA